jgi:hypothetical protein
MNSEQLLLGQRLLFGKSFTTSNSKEHIKSNINQKKFYSRQFFGMSTSLFGEPTPANQGFGARGGGGGITGLVC